MAIIFSAKVYDGMILSDAVNTRYSDPSLNVGLAKAEKYFCQVKTTQVGGTANLTVTLETSADNVNWYVPPTPLFNQSSISNNTVLFNFDLGTASIRAAFARVGVKLGGTTPSAYVEVWLTGRDAS